MCLASELFRTSSINQLQYLDYFDLKFPIFVLKIRFLMHDAAHDSGRLGADLRRLRQAQGLRIADVAALSGRSVGWISQVERGHSQPSYADLSALARAFDLPITQLFRHGLRDQPHGGRVLRREDRRVISSDDAGVVEDLLTPYSDGGVEMYRSVIAAHAASRRKTIRERVETGYIEKGQLDLWIGGDHYSLREGDSFHCRGESLNWMNPHPEPCTVIWVLAPLPDDESD